MKNLKRILVLFMAVLVLTPMAHAESSGGWQKKEEKIRGSWLIEQRSDGNYLIFSDDFKTQSAPDLKIFVSKKPYSEITGKNATDDAVLVSKLKSNKGAQTYKIPSSINLNDYISLVIDCEEYSVLWASTPLR